jgi:cytidine deaminase
MTKKKIQFEISIYDSLEDLTVGEIHLMQTAVDARKNAYAPYSSFQVGAAVLLENGSIVIGNNQENASYPSGLCAERVAVFHAGAKYPNVTIKSIAISATSVNHKVSKPAAPCGNCRQSISEYENRQKEPISVIMMGETGNVIKCNSVSDLLPLAFDGSLL